MGGLFSVALAVMTRASIETADEQSSHAQELPGSLSMEPGLSSLARRACYRDRPVSYDPRVIYTQIIEHMR
jgi:hypothetical protein